MQLTGAHFGHTSAVTASTSFARPHCRSQDKYLHHGDVNKVLAPNAWLVLHGKQSDGFRNTLIEYEEVKEGPSCDSSGLLERTIICA